MNTIHMRFVRAGEITGYGRVGIEPNDKRETWFMVNSGDGHWFLSDHYPHCDLIERGIEVRKEVWYDGDNIEWMYYGMRTQTGTLKWNNEHGMFVVWTEYKFGKDPASSALTPFNLHEVLGKTAKAKRIGNIHEGEKP